jgi:cobaltochelatase CobN
MHVLAIDSATLDTGDEAVDLSQSPGDIVVLSAADTELQLLARAYGSWAATAGAATPGLAAPSLRLANLLNLKHNYSVDLYVDQTLSGAKLIVVRLLGGLSYWPYGIDRLRELTARTGAQLAVLPGDDKSDPSLAGLSTLPTDRLFHLWRCLAEGGPENAARFLNGAAAALADTPVPLPPRPLARAGFIRQAVRDIQTARATVICYRALHQTGDTAPIEALCDALEARGIAASACFITSLKDDASAALLTEHFAECPPDVVLNTTSFASGNVGTEDNQPTHAAHLGTDAPWLQVVLSSQAPEAWAQSTAGLAMREIAMHVSLPELDGRILSRAVSFKQSGARDPQTELITTRAEPNADRVAAVADLASGWARLRRTCPPNRRVGIVLANYPNRDSRLANGVGLATPESVIVALQAMRGAGYRVDGAPTDDGALMDILRAGPTNALAKPVTGEPRNDCTLPLAAYRDWLAHQPDTVSCALHERWGRPDDDPFVRGGAFHLPAVVFANTAIAIQPARGYNVSPKDTYHDPDLIPPHGYLAFYLWLRTRFGAHAVIHFGKHGNLEWLPGKALALSKTCWPDIALGPVPNIYPFIVNDPGEGSQAKRRTAAVVIDHMTPPLTRAETYGPLKDLEALVDEYYDAQAVDRRRAERLSEEIVQAAQRIGLADDCGIRPDDPAPVRLQKLDAYLCDLKELQIRGGLHVFGCAPEDQNRDDLIAALARVPRGERPGDASLQRALAQDLGCDGFDPLDCAFAEPWTGPRPPELAQASNDPWRTNGDTVERIEMLASALVATRLDAPPAWTATRAVLDEINRTLAPAIATTGANETAGLLRALDGRRVAAGPSGAPTRGRWDVLPTGRNFYSLDSRALPTPTAWDIGRKSAEAFVQRYIQDHGDWPRAIAMSAWGTANMRTGGDDLAQALALMGAKPVWDGASRRVTGVEVIPLAALGRPRVDVTLRISGFFRDAFPAQIALIDTAVRMIAARDEPHAENPLRAAFDAAGGDGPEAHEAAQRRALYRVFGSKPGAYGAGLQAMFDEKLWDTQADLAEVFLDWGQYAYGADTHGTVAREELTARLSASDAILHTQDNREHDILDSDDYYQFMGGLTVAATHVKGQDVPAYHGDTSRPERPVVRGLDEEIARVVRARAANPKWISAMMRHGYKGAFEMAATVDYLYAFAATTKAVRDHHFELLFDAYIGDETVRDFLQDKNPDALRDMADKFDDAIAKGLWQPVRNSSRNVIDALKQPAIITANTEETTR